MCSLCSYTTTRKSNIEKHLVTANHLAKESAAAKADLALVAQLRAEIQVLKNTNEILRERAERAEALVREVALKPTVTNNRNRTTHNTLNLISPEPIEWDRLQAEMPKLVTVEALMNNDRKFNGMITDAILKDDEGQSKIICTDQARKQFQYKGEDNEVISDPCLDRLRERMRAGVNYKQLYRELLDHLDSYGGDRSGNAAQASKILARAKFDQGFVNYVAKQTYEISTTLQLLQSLSAFNNIGG